MSRIIKITFLVCVILLLAGCVSQGQPTTLPPVTDPPVTEPVTTTPPVTQPPETEPTQPHIGINPEFWGIDLRGMAEQEAYQTILDTLEHYRLQVTVNKKAFTFTSQELQLTLPQEAFSQWFYSDEITPPLQLLQYDLSFALQTIQDSFTTGVRDAFIAYNTKAGCFTVTTERSGKSVDMTPAEEILRTSLDSLSPTASMQLATTTVAPTVFHTDERIPQALETANSYLTISLSYIFEAPDVQKSTLKFSKATLSGFIAIDKNFQVTVDSDAVQTYITGLSSKYGGTHTKGKFVTTGGKEINLTVQYYGAVLDHESLYNDLMYCLENRISDTRTAAFLSTETASMPYGGNYVEIDLINQMLWVYKNGVQVVSTPIVTGNLSNGVRTPTGVYSVYEKKTDCWLTGKTFRDFVNYWIAFKGNYGIHDASWRQDFGGDIHKYNGSHGCVNLPPPIAGQVYHNVSIGTKVILYGSLSYPDWLYQELSGTDTYELTTQAPPFALDVKAKYPATEITYRSNNTDVVTVDERGVVTVVGPGEATVTVSSAAIGVMKADSFKVHITITEPELPPTEPVTEPSTEPPTEPVETTLPPQEETTLPPDTTLSSEN